MTNWRRKSDAALEAKLAELYELDNPDDDDLGLMESIEDELSGREEYRAEHADTPNLQDIGIEMGSYAS